MKIKYQFQTGQAVEVEVSDDIGEVILQIERDTYNSDRRETRRRISYSDWPDASDLLIDKTADIEEALIRAEEQAAFIAAFSKLSPKDQRLIQRIFVDKLSYAQYAEEIGTSEEYIWVKVHRIRKKLKDQ